MKRLGRHALVFATITLCCTLSTVVGAAPMSSLSMADATTATLGSAVKIAPAFTAKHIVTTSQFGVASASADKATGDVSAHASVSAQVLPLDNSALARLVTTWTATFTGTATFTATIHLNGTLTAAASAPATSFTSFGGASASANVNGGIHVSGTGINKVHTASLESVAAKCLNTNKACSKTNSLPLDGVSTQVQLSVAVQQGQTYTVGTELGVKVSAGTSFGSTGMSASADACLIGAQTKCGGSIAKAVSGIVAVHVQQQT